MATESERRTIRVQELRVEDGEAGPVILGYAALFGVISEDLGGFRESIAPGAFTRTLMEGDARALWQHDPNYVLGRRKNRTLELVEDERGLRIRAVPPDTQWARDAVVTIRRGDVDQMSFGFRVPVGGDRWWVEGDIGRRELLDVDLLDVSPVTFPAYPETSVSVRAMAEQVRAGRQEPPAAGAEAEASARARLALLKRWIELAELEIAAGLNTGPRNDKTRR